MKLHRWMIGALFALGICAQLPLGCAERTHKREVEVHGPDKSYEVEVETKETDHD